MPTTKARYWETLMQHVHDVAQRASENLQERQLRYKVAQNAHFRERNMQIRDGDLVYVQRMVVEQGMSPNLAIPVDGPFEVLKTFSHTFKMRTSGGDVIISSIASRKHRHRRTPLYTRPNQSDETGGDVEEFIVERIISHGDLDDCTRVVRLRWHGYDDSADTWEPTSEISLSFV
jgi:hypothetical protein